jgi:hypothetical protein
MTPLSRRAVLAAGLGAAVLAACGSKSNGGSSGEAASAGGPQVVQFFPDGIAASDSPQRYPFGLGDAKGVLLTTGPDELVATITGEDGSVVADGLNVTRHAKDLPRAYWPLVTKLPAGIYEVKFTGGGTTYPTAAISVRKPSEVKVVRPGIAMPKLVTPTTADPQGVSPVCTRPEPCPLHGVSLDAALAKGDPVALLVGTPAYCKTGICGPVLDILLGARSAYPSITFLHAEIYTDDTLKTTTPTVQGLGMEYEPALFLVGPDGNVRDRVDVIYDDAELQAALSGLTA